MRLLVLLSAAVIAGCSAPASEPAPGSVQTLPSRCEGLPSFAEATSRLDAKLAERARGATFAEPAAAYASEAPLALGYALAGAGDPNDDRLKVPRILRSKEEVQADSTIAWMLDALTVDWASEAVAVVEEHPSDTRYRYAVDSETFRVVSARAHACLAESDEAVQEAALAATRPRLFRVPRTVTRAAAEAVATEAYRPALPRASGACTRAEGTVFAGGGNASVVRHDGGVRLYVNGFSAMTGNVFHVDSTDDGATFAPNGWDANNLSSFEGRGPYADVYGPFVERTDAGFRMSGVALDFSTREARIVEMRSPDGKAWTKGERLVADDGDVSGVSRITVDGEDRLFFVRDGAVRLARRRGEAAFVLDPEPVLVPPPVTSDAFDALGYVDTSIVRAGDRFVLVVTAATGGYDRRLPLRTSIGYATSPDGVRFERKGDPILVTERDDELRGVGSPAVLPSAGGSAFTLFYTAINGAAEPRVARATCALE